MGGVCKFEEYVDGYSKMAIYRGMLLDPARVLRNKFGVGSLPVEDKMWVYIITYILAPRSKNHAQVTDGDLGTIDRRYHVEKSSTSGL